MRPPICAICGDDFDPDEGGLVGFARGEAYEKWKKRADETPDFVGHPPDSEWFCEDHIERARELTHLTRSEALAKF